MINSNTDLRNLILFLLAIFVLSVGAGCVDIDPDPEPPYPLNPYDYTYPPKEQMTEPWENPELYPLVQIKDPKNGDFVAGCARGFPCSINPK